MISIIREIYIIILLLFFIFLPQVQLQEILCNQCHTKISENHFIKNIKSSASLTSKYKSKFYKKKVLSHTFRNPHNILFEVITVEEAALTCQNVIHDDTTFFPGFGWKICVCPVCGSHHGWHFSPTKKNCELEKDIETCMNKNSFYGLVTSSLTSSHSEKIEL